MPYHVEERNGKFAVINTETEVVKEEKEIKEDAERLARLLNEMEKDAEDATE